MNPDGFSVLCLAAICWGGTGHMAVRRGGGGGGGRWGGKPLSPSPGPHSIHLSRPSRQDPCSPAQLPQDASCPPAQTRSPHAPLSPPDLQLESDPMLPGQPGKGPCQAHTRRDGGSKTGAMYEGVVLSCQTREDCAIHAPQTISFA